MIREPAVSGQFYPGSSKALVAKIESIVDKSHAKEKARAVVSPHAGYIYSGPVAGAVFSEVEIPDTVIILGPNHTGAGVRFSLYKKGTWRTPLGEAAIDVELADSIHKHSAIIKADTLAHVYEHSLEVQVPFLQYFNASVNIVPIVLSPADLDTYREVAEAIALGIRERKGDVLIVASSDMTHYEPHKTAVHKDKIAIDAILKLDERLLLEKVSEYNISMCGAVPVAIMLITVKSLGAAKARLVKYQTSGDTSGDYSAVVGYAGIIIK